MAKAIDMSGQKCNRLTFVERAFVKYTKVFWKCKCDCGAEIFAPIGAVRSGNTKSCGCLSIERKKEDKRGEKHGKINTRLYNIWASMKYRCKNPNGDAYKHYGGRGIRICDEWKDDFQIFWDWAISNGYQDTLTIERIDVNGNYEPSNCTWATTEQQNRNKTTSIFVEINGVNKSLIDLSKETGIKFQTLYGRYRRGRTGLDLIRKVI